MCGIVGFAGRERAVPYLTDCLGRLEYRGYDSAGISVVGNNGIGILKEKGKVEVLKKRYEERYPIYNSTCDIKIDGNGTPNEVADIIYGEYQK